MNLQEFKEFLRENGYDYGDDAAENALVGFNLAVELQCKNIASELIAIRDQMVSCPCHECVKNNNRPRNIFGIETPADAMYMVVCPTCGNKRCPHANDHRNLCTGSNATGQPGSYYS